MRDIIERIELLEGKTVDAKDVKDLKSALRYLDFSMDDVLDYFVDELYDKHKRDILDRKFDLDDLVDEVADKFMKDSNDSPSLLSVLGKSKAKSLKKKIAKDLKRPLEKHWDDEIEHEIEHFEREQRAEADAELRYWR